jgi:hypothetical protein
MGFLRHRVGRRSSDIPQLSVLEKMCEDNQRPRSYTSPQLWQPEDEDDVASKCESYEISAPKFVPCTSDGSTCSTATHSSHSMEVETLRSFVGLHVSITRNLEKRVADLEAQLAEQVDERQSAMLNYALVMKKVTRLEARCSELEARNIIRQSSNPEPTCDLELRFEQLEAHFDAVLNDMQPVELERRLEGLSMAAEKALEETRRVSTEFMAAASRFTQQLGVVESCQEQLVVDDGSHGKDSASPASVPLETARTSSPCGSLNQPIEALRSMEKNRREQSCCKSISQDAS